MNIKQLIIVFTEDKHIIMIIVFVKYKTRQHKLLVNVVLYIYLIFFLFYIIGRTRRDRAGASES